MTTDELRKRFEAAGIEVTILGFVDEADVAKALNVAQRTLRRFRQEGTGPQATLIGKRWHYSVDAIAAYLSAHMGQTRTDAVEDDTRANAACGQITPAAERDGPREKSE